MKNTKDMKKYELVVVTTTKELREVAAWSESHPRAQLEDDPQAGRIMAKDIETRAVRKNREKTKPAIEESKEAKE